MKTEKVKINGQVELEIEEGMSVSEKNGVVRVSSLETRLNNLMNGLIANMIEKVEKWTPKNGDFVAHTDKYGDTLISIFKEFRPDGTVANHAGVGDGPWRDLLIDDWSLAEWADRPATEPEIKIMNDALAKAGKRWNAAAKRIEDIKLTVVEMTMEQVCEKLGMNVKIVKK